MRILIRPGTLSYQDRFQNLRQVRFLTLCCLSHKQNERFLVGHGQYVGMEVPVFIIQGIVIFPESSAISRSNEARSDAYTRQSNTGLLYCYWT